MHADPLAGRASWTEQPAGVELVGAADPSTLRPFCGDSQWGQLTAAIGAVGDSTALLLVTLSWPRHSFPRLGISPSLCSDYRFQSRGPQAQSLRIECALTYSYELLPPRGKVPG